MDMTIQDDIFDKLPAELNIQVFSYLSPGDLSSAVHASPSLARVYLWNRDPILSPRLPNFFLRFGQIDAVPMIEFLSELRSIRDRHTTIADIEKHIEPVLDAMLRLDIYRRPERWRLGLSTLVKADILIPEMQESFMDHCRTAGDTPLESENQWLSFDQMPSKLIWLFAKIYLAFECHCSIFNHSDGVMLQSRSNNADALFLRDIRDVTELHGTVFEQFCQHCCLYRRHEYLYEEALDCLDAEQSPLIDGSISISMHDTVLRNMAIQGYRYHVYMEDLVEKHADIERYIWEVARMAKRVAPHLF
ncbi:hypothetical protein FPSE_11321 [Fusarium pseudograminearum CS3096]|uniref:F-box domain-containing protein n=1 Tax=Fusarium pseudograminearum (strain CS3096) TaxID=1028729 RepID=K3V8U1_FUSPC|nr:hypothetical protein FPSE_11321 [Fusarium pseudograminearum CS3096]EKJ68313.1 hypothetical protein FPSE_11321 [Fusarium pseudograminearum CS3096]KAF0644652.1 hypothetical protein FPSE5266_11321 [Fusarium pseudograminearum]